MLVDADALPMSQQSFVKIVDGSGIVWQQRLQEVVRVVRRHLLPDQAQATRDSVNVYIDGEQRLLATEEEHAGGMPTLRIRKPYNKLTKKYTLSCLMC